MRFPPKDPKLREHLLRKHQAKMATYYADPWLSWNATYTTSASTIIDTQVWNQWTSGTTASTNVIWNSWMATPYPPTGSSIATNVWQAWQEYNGNQVNRYHDPQTLYQPPKLTEEQIRERDERMERQRQEAEERRQKEIEARQRAKDLLLDHLSPAQKQTYERQGEFRVEVGSRTFVIARGTHGNVREVHVDGNGREVTLRSFCIPAGNPTIPEPDVHLAQKLMLEGGDDSVLDFHRIANITEYEAARTHRVRRLDHELVGIG